MYFNQSFRKFRSKTEWIGSVQTEKFRKIGSTFPRGALLSVGPVRPKLTVPFDLFDSFSMPIPRCSLLFIGVTRTYMCSNPNYKAVLRSVCFGRFALLWHMGNSSPYVTTVKIGGNRQEEFRNEIIEKNTPKNYFLVNFSRFLSFRPISGLHFNELLISYSAPFQIPCICFT